MHMRLQKTVPAQYSEKSTIKKNNSESMPFKTGLSMVVGQGITEEIHCK